MHDKIPDGVLVKISWSEGRTLSQNALSHMWYTDIAKHFIDRGKTTFKDGDPINSETMKDSLKNTFLGCEEKEHVNLKTGEVTKTIELRHTSDLEKGDMTNYLMLIDVYCQENRIYIRKPADSEYVEIMKQIGEMV
jgi:hypothetical protein